MSTEIETPTSSDSISENSEVVQVAPKQLSRGVRNRMKREQRKAIREREKLVKAMAAKRKNRNVRTTRGIRSLSQSRISWLVDAVNGERATFWGTQLKLQEKRLSELNVEFADAMEEGNTDNVIALALKVKEQKNNVASIRVRAATDTFTDDDEAVLDLALAKAISSVVLSFVVEYDESKDAEKKAAKRGTFSAGTMLKIRSAFAEVLNAVKDDAPRAAEH